MQNMSHLTTAKKTHLKHISGFGATWNASKNWRNDLSFRQLTNFKEKRKTGNGSMFDCTSTTLHRDPLFGIFVSNIIFF
jgi:hypothetical protein